MATHNKFWFHLLAIISLFLSVFVLFVWFGGVFCLFFLFVCGCCLFALGFFPNWVVSFRRIMVRKTNMLFTMSLHIRLSPLKETSFILFNFSTCKVSWWLRIFWDEMWQNGPDMLIPIPLKMTSQKIVSNDFHF